MVSAVTTAPVAAVSAIADEKAPVAPALGEHQSLPQQTAGETNNTSGVIHENPDEVDDEDDLNRLISYLSGELNTQIGSSTLRLSQGEYEAAKSALGDDYDDSLSKYVDVEGETDGDGSREEYETVQETQREYIDTVREFHETRRKYEAAKQAGETERARELARRLSRLAEDGETQSGSLVDMFGSISNETDSDLTETSTQLASIQSNITEQRNEIIGREFIATNLTVESYEQNISFTDPLVLSGSLATDNGTPVEATNASFAIGGQTLQTAVDADGQFELTYRPIRVPANSSELTVTYLPSNSSVYQISEQTIPVSVTQVTATTALSGPAKSAYGYADSVSLRATVSVNETPIANYPISASLGGVPLSTAETDSSGRSTLTGTIPATASVGTAAIRVAPDRDGRAVRFEPGTVSVPITSEETALDVRARTSANRTVVIDGQLETQEGEAVGDQPVTVSIDGQTIDTVTTGESGTYRTTIDLPADVSARNATVTVAFDGDGTNLDSSSATTDIPRPSGGGESAGGGLPFGLFDLLWVVSGTAIVGLVAAVLLRRGNETAASDGGTAEPVISTHDEETEPESADVVATALESAVDSLSAGRPNDAVVVAYAGARNALAAATDIDAAATHWEFYEQCVDAEVGSAESLESLTAGYETAAYSGVSVSEDDAEQLVETAHALVDATEPDTLTN
ncbi:hypothetical protein E6P09_00535 [Haloferax mediterranei ATCC 33500]|uniref:DUF4129 domain-containing protein n=1 Tax=Haloferax mediterranei (strain ATCC 33500 / DSM 1411 / JCM 8866 / NBRC 14739 / NCIMB 2177 / R-4) TaxID=523841 RepID=M0IVG3_HALMT|nr:hypothetical protein [Haloferax mediterranei]AHZ23298.1 hypothetical protein BM92_11900 [Haloferax mediterranei ATCC 33500]ELZ99464.1 hypothetical protein C439_12959 [Haloferax mediterranei ATCC 33500]MDX5987331.1 hypothetical protein [Haloferax mediterranei ATCC 33500]QCQ73846.1 hypothetical protein E6P09_00535 [Haloferax mediterranei ATCC 33500]